MLRLCICRLEQVIGRGQLCIDIVEHEVPRSRVFDETTPFAELLLHERIRVSLGVDDRQHTVSFG